LHPDMPVKDRLELITRLGGFASVSALAREANISEGAMRQHARRDSLPYQKAQSYVRASGTDATPEWLMSGRGAAPTGLLPRDMRASNKIVLLEGRSGGRLTRPAPIDHAKVAGEVEAGVSKERPPEADFPVYGTTELGGSVVELSAQPAFHADRPSWSKSASDFSYFVSTDGMFPAINRGDRVEVNALIPPLPGNLVVLISGTREDGWRAIIRELVSLSDKQWRVKQYRPEKVETFERAEWHTAYKVGGIVKA
jgi:hypothetical protein